MEALDGGDGAAFEDVAVAEGLHAEDGNAFVDEAGDDMLDEAAEVGVHDVERHLAGVEVEVVGSALIEHTEMDRGVLMAGEADVADFSGLLGGEDGFERAVGSEETVGVFETDVFVELDEVDVIGLKTLEGFIDLDGGGGFGAAVEFGHEERFGAVAVAKGPAHADLGFTAVVIPAIVEEIHATVEGGADDGDADGGVLGAADVVAAEADGGDALAGFAERAVGHGFLFGRGGGGESDGGESGESFAAIHGVCASRGLRVASG